MMNIAIRRTGVYSPFSVDLAGNYDIDIARLFFCIAEGGGDHDRTLACPGE